MTGENINTTVNAAANPDSAEIELREGVENIRKCSFKPQEHFITLPGGYGKNTEPSLYLEVKWRAFWFQTYCAENGIQNYAIEEGPVTLITGTSYLQATCQVKMNGYVVGQGVGGYLIRPDQYDLAYAVQQASTIAKGRALANAGFGTVFSSASASENGGQEIPCDAGMRTSEFFVRHPKNPMMMIPKPDEAESNADSVKADDAEKSESSDANAQAVVADNPAESPAQEEAPAEAASHPMTREEAIHTTISIRGRYAGAIMGEVLAKNPSYVQYCATNARYAGTKEQEAAKLLLDI